MRLQGWEVIRKRRMRFAMVILVASAALHSTEAMAKDPGACTVGTTLRLSAPEASLGSSLLIELKSAQPLAGVLGDWRGRTLPMWREGTDQAMRRIVMGVDH